MNLNASVSRRFDLPSCNGFEGSFANENHSKINNANSIRIIETCTKRQWRRTNHPCI